MAVKDILCSFKLDQTSLPTDLCSNLQQQTRTHTKQLRVTPSRTTKWKLSYGDRYTTSTFMDQSNDGISYQQKGKHPAFDQHGRFSGQIKSTDKLPGSICITTHSWLPFLRLKLLLHTTALPENIPHCEGDRQLRK